MLLRSDHELENTCRRLREREGEYQAAVERPVENPEVRESTLSSMRRLINELQEEIARYEARQPARR